MTNITKISFTAVELFTLDIDWFASDSEGNIGHFTSVGTPLIPEKVVVSKDITETVFTYIENLPQLTGEFTLSKHLQRWRTFSNEKQYQRYILASSEFAERGCFSFDCRAVHPKYPGPYFVVAIPSVPLKLNALPKEIAECIQLLTFPFPFDESTVIGLDEFLIQKWIQIDKEFRIQIGALTL